MNFEKDYVTMVFVNVFDDRKIYSIGLSKKNKNGGYDKGYIQARFKKEVDLENKTKIKVKESWLSFNKNEKKTFPYVFINDFEILAEAKPTEEEDPFKDFGAKTKSDISQQIEITDNDLPF